MGYYMKKPVVIEAIQWTGKNREEIEKFCPTAKFQIIDTAWEVHKGPAHTLLTIPTLEGDHYAIEGDYIIKGVRGEFYPYKEDIFLETYQPVDSTELKFTLTATEITPSQFEEKLRGVMHWQDGLRCTSEIKEEENPNE